MLKKRVPERFKTRFLKNTSKSFHLGGCQSHFYKLCKHLCNMFITSVFLGLYSLLFSYISFMKFKEWSNAYLLTKSKLGINITMSVCGHTHVWNLMLTPFQFTAVTSFLHHYADESNRYNTVQSE